MDTSKNEKHNLIHSPAWHSCRVWPLQTEWRGLHRLHYVEPRRWLSRALLLRPQLFPPVSSEAFYWSSVVDGDVNNTEEKKNTQTHSHDKHKHTQTYIHCMHSLVQLQTQKQSDTYKVWLLTRLLSLISSFLTRTPLTQNRTGACFPGLPLFFLPFTSGSSISLMLILKPTASVAPDSLDESLKARNTKDLYAYESYYTLCEKPQTKPTLPKYLFNWGININTLTCVFTYCAKIICLCRHKCESFTILNKGLSTRFIRGHRGVTSNIHAKINNSDLQYKSTKSTTLEVF